MGATELISSKLGRGSMLLEDGAPWFYVKLLITGRETI
jgi:hypothetical protein